MIITNSQSATTHKRRPLAKIAGQTFKLKNSNKVEL